MSTDADARTELSPDLVFDLLSSKRRRMVLYYLRRHSGTATVNELAEQIAAWENDVDVEELSRQQQKRVYVSLYQTHIPKLEQAGIIDYDEEESEVTLTDRAVETDTYLTPATEAVYPWQVHYLVLALVSGVALALSVVGVPVISAVPPLWLGVGITLAFAVSAIGQYLARRRRREQLPRELDEEW